MELVFQIWRLHIFLTGKHLICVAADGVDLTVMYDETVRMCSLPARVCVGTETGMYHCNGRFVILALKISEESTELSYQEHTFVYNGTAAHGNYVSIIITLFKLTAGNVKHTVKGKAFFHVFRFLDECLHDAWHTLSCLMSKNLREYRHCTPSKKLQAFFFHDDLEHLLCLGTFDLMLWEKELGYTIFSLASDLKALFLTDFFEEFMGDLEKDTDAIAGFSFCIFTCTMLQILYDLKSICNSIMCFLSFYINNGSDTAVIMFEFRAVEALLLISYFSHFSHPFIAASSAVFLSTAACTNPRNSGCAWFGLDLNSGCPCVPTKNGCPAISIISTICASGEVPTMDIPFSLNSLRNALFTS